jgi:hypothetical protein
MFDSYMFNAAEPRVVTIYRALMSSRIRAKYRSAVEGSEDPSGTSPGGSPGWKCKPPAASLSRTEATPAGLPGHLRRMPLDHVR